MKGKLLIIIAMILLLMPSQAFAEELTVEFDDIQPYTGSFPPSHILYRFKLMLERFDEGLTFNPVKKMEKKMDHAQLRLSEAKREMLFNRTQDAEKVMSQYRAKIYEVNEEVYDNMARTTTIRSAVNTDIASVSTSDIIYAIEMDEQLENMQKRMEQHRLVLENMQQRHSGMDIDTAVIEQIRTQLRIHTGDEITAKFRQKLR